MSNAIYRYRHGTCHNPYFNRWFSAIEAILDYNNNPLGHNPYFNRWFSAISFSLSYTIIIV